MDAIAGWNGHNSITVVGERIGAIMDKALAWIKDHPYETGALVLVVIGGSYVILSSSSGASGSATAAQSGTASSSSYYADQLQLDQLNAQQGAQAATLQAQTDQANIQASVANNQTQAQLSAVQIQNTSAVQAATIAAGVADTATAAQVAVTNAQTAAQVSVASLQAGVTNAQTAGQVQENSDNLAAVLGLVSSQNAVQVNAQNDALATVQTNDQTAVDLSGQQYDYLSNTATLQAGVDTTELNDATTVETQAQKNQLALAQTIIPLAGQQKNSALDATDQTALFQTILSGGNAGVAASGNVATSTADTSGNGQLAGVLKTVSPILTAASGLFA
jgi:hypothetical protein